VDVFNQCLTESTVPACWKEARVVFPRKGNKPIGVPSSYRPLCLLNDVGKIFEGLLTARLDAYTTSKGGLAFRKGRSTDNAVKELRDKAEHGRARER